MILLDTNLLVYARNSTSPFHKKAKQIRDQAVDGVLKAAVTLQTLSEYLAIITTDSRRMETPLSPAEATDDVRSYLEAVQLKKLTLTERTTARLADLVKKYRITAQRIFDAQIVAAMLENKIQEIWTANDKDFTAFGTISTVNPFGRS